MDNKTSKGNRKVYLIYEFLSEQGGLEREIINHANFLKEDGFSVKILTCHKSREIEKLLPFENLEIEEISVIKTPYESLNLILCFIGLNKLKKYSPDLFISYSFPCNYLLRKKNIKKLNYLNHFPHFLYLSNKEKIEWASSTPGLKRKISVLLSFILGSFLKKLDQKLGIKNDLNLTNSFFTKNRLDKIYNTSMKVVYPPIDPKFLPSSKKISTKYIFSSSRIIPDKKYEWLIKSLKYSQFNYPLLIAGSVEEEYKKKLEDLAKKNNVKLNFLGKLDTKSIIDYYTNAEVFAFSTPGEDFGLVPAESLSCGTPCVVWGDGSGPTEQIVDGENGFFAKPYDLKDFAKKLDLCIKFNFKEKNRRKIIKSAKKFSAKRVKKEFMGQVNALLSTRP